MHQGKHLPQCQRILAIPLRRISHPDPTYLSTSALAALLAQPDRSTRRGWRDAVLLSVLYDTGARVQELIDLRVRDVHLGAPARVRLTAGRHVVADAELANLRFGAGQRDVVFGHGFYLVRLSSSGVWRAPRSNVFTSL